MSDGVFQARLAKYFAGSMLRHISFLTVSFWKSSARMHRHHRRFGSLKRQRRRTHKLVFPGILLWSAMSKHQNFLTCFRIFGTECRKEQNTSFACLDLFGKMKKGVECRIEEPSRQIEAFIPSSLVRGLGILLVSHHTVTAIKFEKKSSDRSFAKGGFFRLFCKTCESGSCFSTTCRKRLTIFGQRLPR